MVSIASGAVKSFFYAGSLGEVLPPRWAYLIQLILGFFGVVFLKLFGNSLFKNFTFFWDSNLSEKRAVIIVFFAFFLYHLIMACCLFGVNSSSEGRSKIHNCFWPVKTIFWALFALFTWALIKKYQDTFLLFIWPVSLLFGCLFLIAEGFAVICLSSSLNEWMVEKVTDGRKSFLFALISLMILFAGGFIALSIVAAWYSESSTKSFWLFLNVIAIALQLVTCAIPRVRAANPKANVTFIFATSLFTLFLLVSSWEIISNVKNSTQRKIYCLIHCIFLFIALIQETIQLTKEDENSKSVLSIPAAVASAEEGQANATPVDSGESFEDFCFSKQHLLYCFISALLIPILCNWKWESHTITGQLSMGFSIFASIFVHFLVFWVLVAPMVLDSREF
jgi:hypothetical protein